MDVKSNGKGITVDNNGTVIDGDASVNGGFVVTGNSRVEGQFETKGTTHLATTSGSDAVLGNSAGTTQVNGKTVTTTGTTSVETKVGDSTIKTDVNGTTITGKTNSMTSGTTGNTIINGESGNTITAAVGATNAINGDTDITGTLDVTGTTNINTTGNADTSIGNTTGKVGITGNQVDINTAAGAGATKIGSANNTSAVTIASGSASLVTESGNNTLTVGNGGTNTIEATGTGKNVVKGTTEINATGNAATTIGSADADAGDVTLQSGQNSVVINKDTGTKVTGNMEVTGNTQLDGTLTVAKNTTLNGDVNQIGNADGSSTSNTLTAKNNTIKATGANTIKAGDDTNGYNQIVVNNTGAAEGVIVNAIGTTDGVVMNGGVAGQQGNATMVLSGTKAALTASTGTGLVINNDPRVPDTTILSGGASTGTASTVTLADNSARVMTSGGNGMWADASSANLTGGGNALSMSSSGARFHNERTGGPIKVTGVANGTSKYDAVNYGQLQDVERLASRGIASVTAMTNIPQVEQGKTFAVGAGIGSYNGYQALAIGASGRIMDDLVFKASIGSSENGHAAFGGGVSYSW